MDDANSWDAVPDGDDAGDIRHTGEAALPANQYTHLPEHIRLEDTVTSADVREYPPTPDDETREREWLLRNVAFGA